MGGSGMLHHLVHTELYSKYNYAQKIMPIQFAEKITAGIDSSGEELMQDSKTVATNDLATFVQNGSLRFSEFDFEGVSQLERLAKQNNISGKPSFFILSDAGSGKDDDDHIYASYVCFVLGIRTIPNVSTTIRKIARPIGSMTK